jgi:MFS family permease
MSRAVNSVPTAEHPREGTPTSTTATGAPAAPLAYPPLSRAGYVIGVLFVVTLVSQLDRQLPALMVGPLRAEFGISDTAFSLMQGYAFVLSFTLMGVPLGRFVDGRNRRNLIAAGLLFWSAATALFAFGRSYTELVVARLALGIGEAVLAPAAYSLIADLVAPHRRGRALAFYGVSIAIGSGASLLLAGWLMAVIPAGGLAVAGLGELAAWRLAFLVAALPGVPLALLLMATVREPARQRDVAADSSRQETPSLADFIRYLRRQPATFFRLLCYPAILTFVGYGALAWAPALFERSHGISPAQSAVALGLGVAVAGTLGMLASGFLSDGWLARGVPAARLRVALVGVAVVAPPAVLWPLVPGPVTAFGLLFLLVFGISVAQSAVPTSIQAVFPNRLRGKAMGAYLLVSGVLGIGLGPTAVALVTDHLFQDDSALRYAIALTAGPAALFGLWLIASGLAPYAHTHDDLHAPAPLRPSPITGQPPAAG